MATIWDQIDDYLKGEIPSAGTIRIKLSKENFVRLVAGETIVFKAGTMKVEIKKDV